MAHSASCYLLWGSNAHHIRQVSPVPQTHTTGSEIELNRMSTLDSDCADVLRKRGFWDMTTATGSQLTILCQRGEAEWLLQARKTFSSIHSNNDVGALVCRKIDESHKPNKTFHLQALLALPQGIKIPIMLCLFIQEKRNSHQNILKLFNTRSLKYSKYQLAFK